ncbi:MAG: beta-ketoacyl-[acyl-carrier-protein] synthase family protein [Azospirillaceae bacterium]
MHRVAITGLGCISALGHSAAEHWQAARDGRSGIGEISQVSPDLLQVKVAAEVRGFDATGKLSDSQLVSTDRFTQFAIIAARDAVADAGLTFSDELAEETAAIIGTGIGGAVTIDANADRVYAQKRPRLHPMSIPKTMPSAAASYITMDLGLHGPAFGVTSACSSANHAIGEALWMVRTGRARAAVTGGSESCLTYGSLLAWQALRVMAMDTCRPFCVDRKGMVLGEGAGILVLERLDDAKARGARIYAELAGTGLSSDAGSLTDPSAEGAALAMRRALKDAGVAADEIGYINAHGTGTGQNDPAEAAAIHLAFASRGRAIPVSSTKSMHGHCLGAAGALESVITAKAVAEQVAPPTANFTTADPACDLRHVPNEAIDIEVGAALSNSFAFGGLNSVLVMRRVS